MRSQKVWHDFLVHIPNRAKSASRLNSAEIFRRCTQKQKRPQRNLPYVHNRKIFSCSKRGRRDDDNEDDRNGTDGRATPPPVQQHGLFMGIIRYCWLSSGLVLQFFNPAMTTPQLHQLQVREGSKQIMQNSLFSKLG